MPGYQANIYKGCPTSISIYYPSAFSRNNGTIDVIIRYQCDIATPDDLAHAKEPQMSAGRQCDVHRFVSQVDKRLRDTEDEDWSWW